MSSEHDQPAAQGREQTGETPNAEQRAARDAGGRDAAGRQGGGRERERERERRGRRGGGGGGGHAQQPQQQQRHQQQGQQRRVSDSSLNMDELRELTELFSAHGLTDFEFENADIRVRLSRNPAPQSFAAAPAPPPSSATHAAPAHAAAPTAHTTQAAQPSPTQAPSPAPPAEEKPEELHIITSPIVGTFYRSPSPDADPYVGVGSAVEPKTVVCIIEAMKMMNPVLADTTGTVEKIYVENGQPVEYDQPLFGVKK